MSQYAILYKYNIKRTRKLLERVFIFILSLVFYIWEAFLNKQLLHSRLLDMK